MIYAIWDLATWNLVGEFESLEKALLALHPTLIRLGSEQFQTIGISGQNEAGEDVMSMTGDELVAMIMATSVPVSDR